MRILMASDLSTRCDRAVARAVALAKEFDAELEVLTVIEEVFFKALTRSNKAFAANALAEQVAAVPDAKSVRLRERVIFGVDYENIIKRSEEFDVDLIVLGVHRHERRELFQGTTAERVIRYGTRPVLVVKKPVRGPYRRVTAANDLSPQSEAAALTAARLSPTGEVDLTHAVNPSSSAFTRRQVFREMIEQERQHAQLRMADQIQRMNRQLGDDAPRFKVSFPEAYVYSAITSAVEKNQSDLLAIGTHGRAGVAHAIIGSVAEQLLAECPVDILAVKKTPHQTSS